MIRELNDTGLLADIGLNDTQTGTLIRAQEDPLGLALDNSGLNQTERTVVVELLKF